MNSSLKIKGFLFVYFKPVKYLSTNTGNISNAIFSINFKTNKRREYVKKELIGYSMEQMYSVVSDVNNYKKFVPYVKKSNIHTKTLDGFKADLIVGFSPITEEYTSNVKIIPASLVTAECYDGKLFQYLKNEWRFSPGLKDIPQSCVIDFVVLFQFKSILHSQIANLFFDIICDQMEYAFHTEVKRRYGPPAINSLILSSTKT